MAQLKTPIKHQVGGSTSLREVRGKTTAAKKMPKLKVLTLYPELKHQRKHRVCRSRSRRIWKTREAKGMPISKALASCLDSKHQQKHRVGRRGSYREAYGKKRETKYKNMANGSEKFNKFRICELLTDKQVQNLHSL